MWALREGSGYISLVLKGLMEDFSLGDYIDLGINDDVFLSIVMLMCTVFMYVTGFVKRGLVFHTHKPYQIQRFII